MNEKSIENDITELHNNIKILSNRLSIYETYVDCLQSQFIMLIIGVSLPHFIYYTKSLFA